MFRIFNFSIFYVVLTSILLLSACTVKVNKTSLNSTTEYVLTLSAACGDSTSKFSFFEEAQNPQIKIQTGKTAEVNGQKLCALGPTSALVEAIDLSDRSRTEFPQPITLKTSSVQIFNLGRAGIECLYFSAQDGVSGALIGELSVFYDPTSKVLEDSESNLSLMTHKTESITDVGGGGFIKECR